jgi:hypothetical protein
MDDDEYDIYDLQKIVEEIRNEESEKLNIPKALYCIINEILMLHQDSADLFKFIPLKYKKAFPLPGEPKLFSIDSNGTQSTNEPFKDIISQDATKCDIADAKVNMHLNLLKHIEKEVKVELDDFILTKKRELNEKYYKKYGLEY